MSARREKREFVIYTDDGMSFCEKATTIERAIRRAAVGDRTILAVVEAACVVTPAPAKLTALIVRQSGGGAP